MSDPDKVLMQIIDTMLPILTGAMRSTVTGLLDEAYARGVADERAKVVASLRKRATELRDNLPDNVAGELNDMADHYERGDHEEKP